MRPQAKEKHPREVLVQRLDSAVRDETTKKEKLVRMTARGVGAEHAEQEARRATQTRNEIEAEIVALDQLALDQRKEG